MASFDEALEILNRQERKVRDFLDTMSDRATVTGAAGGLVTVAAIGQEDDPDPGPPKPYAVAGGGVAPVAGSEGLLLRYPSLGSVFLPFSNAQNTASAPAVFDVHAFGAVGDGATDDRAAVMAAFDAAEPVNGVVWFRSGFTYLISSRVSVPGGLTLDGPGATVVLDAEAAQTALFNIAGDGVTIRNLTLVGPHVDEYAVGWVGVRASGVVADYLDGIVLDGLTIRHFGQSGVWMEFCRNVAVRNCTITQCGHDGIVGESVARFHVRACRIADLSPGDGGDVGFENMYGVTFTRSPSSTLADAPPSAQCSVIDCVVENVPTWKGLDTHGGHDILFANNTIRNCYIGVGIDESNQIGGDEDLNPPLRISVIGNRFVAGGTKIAQAVRALSSGTTEEDQAGRGLLIEGNTIEGYGGNAAAADQRGAIYLHSWRDVTIVGNYLANSNRAAVHLAGVVAGVTIVGNTFFNLVTLDSTNYAIWCPADTYQLVVDGNVYRRTTGTFVAYEFDTPAAGYGVTLGLAEAFVGTITRFAGGALANVLGGSFAGLLSLAAGIRSEGASPGIANGAAAGTSPGSPTLVGTDRAGVITVVTGTATTTGTLATVTFAAPKADADYVVILTPIGTASCAEIAKVRATNRLTTGWVINVPTTPLTVSTTYTYNYIAEAYEP